MNVAPPDCFTLAYIKTALWSSTDESRDDGGDPLDDNYCAEDLSPEALAKMIQDCAEFRERAAGLAIHSSGTMKDETSIAHDFWLTRNGHGAGFWDGDYEEPLATALTDLSKSFGECHLLVGDDGRIHCM